MSAEKPLVSVVMPTYRQPQYIETSVLGFLAQTYFNKELIIVHVVDDQETEAKLNVIRNVAYPGRYGPRDIKTIPTEKPSIIHQTNIGINQAHGDYITFIASDDFMLPGKIADEVHVAQVRNALLVYSLYFYGDENLTIIGMPQNVPDFSYDTLIRGNYITDISLVHRSVYDEFGLFDESLGTLAVYDKWLHVAEKYPDRIVRNPVATFIYRQHPDQASKKRIALQQKDGFELYKKVVEASLKRMGQEVKPEDLDFRVTQA
jgi:glycosyltransferase involved in cell wall biosynthesis